MSPTDIIDYLIEIFNDKGKLVCGGKEYIVPSIFLDSDLNYHLSINIETGLWQCFKTGNRGNLAKLISLIENITYTTAEQKLLLKELFPKEEKKKIGSKNLQTVAEENVLDFIIPLSFNNLAEQETIVYVAWNMVLDRFLLNTKIEPDKEQFYVTTDKLTKKGLRNRLLIPYRDHSGRIFFYQLRALLPGQKPKYLNPPESVIKASHILYPFDKNPFKELVITEGPLDAISLQINGINATCIQGSYMSKEQLTEIADSGIRKIILGFDNDDSGQRCVRQVAKMCSQMRLPAPYFCSPPEEYKDWNEAHVDFFELKEYIKQCSRQYSWESNIISELNKL